MTEKFEPTVKYNYFDLGAGKCTIAYQISANRGEKIRTVKFGVSYCSPNDQFYKKDYTVYKTEFSEPVTRENWKTVGRQKVVSKKIQGGRSRAREALISNPIEMEFVVPKDANAIVVALNHMKNVAFDKAPSWKNKFKMRKLRTGGLFLSMDGVGIKFADPNEEYLVVLLDENQESIPVA